MGTTTTGQDNDDDDDSRRVKGMQKVNFVIVDSSDASKLVLNKFQLKGR